MDTDGQLEALLDLEARHDDLLKRLDELDQRVSQVLDECLPKRSVDAECTPEDVLSPAVEVA